MKTKRLLGLVAGVAILASACSGGGASTAPSAAASVAASQPAASQAASTAPSVAAATPGPSLPTAAELGSTQGQTINVLAWPGYVENGSTYPTYDWVTDFQKQTGCTVKPQTFGTSDEAYTLFSTNPEQFDIVSASGDASLRLVRGGFVQPVNLDLIKNYADIFPALKNKPYNTVDGVPVRHPARSRLEPADVADRPGQARRRPPGPRCSTRPTATRSASTTPRSTSPTPPSS